MCDYRKIPPKRPEVLLNAGRWSSRGPREVYARERLIIESAGQGAYELMPDGFVLLGRDLVENDLEQTESNKLSALLGPSFPPSHPILQAATPYSQPPHPGLHSS